MDANHLVGRTIHGRYYIVRQLGRGGVGITFLAHDKQCFDTPCVVKQLKPKSEEPKTLEVARRLFNREAEIMNRLGYCDRIPRLLAYFEYEKDFFLVQELVEGHDLSQEIVPGRPWSEEKTLTFLKDILEVLLVVQKHSVIHRDLKPSNLMRRSKDDKIVLIDFGSVKQVSTQVVDSSGQPRPTVAVGTRSYMPMEQMMGRPGFHSDIYAVGVIAIQALTGVSPQELPVDRDGEIIWRNKLDGHFKYNLQLLDLIDKMVRYRHQERYKSANQVLNDLEKLNPEEDSSRETVIIHSGSTAIPEQPAPEIGKATEIIDSKPDYSPPIQPKPEPVTPVKPPVPVTQSNFPLKATVIGVITTALAGLGAWGLWSFSPSESIPLGIYENSSQGFKISYPENWSQQNREDFFTSGVIFISAFQNETDNFQERVSVFVETISPETSLAQYSEQSIAEIKKLSDPNVGSPETTNLGENEARKVVYRGEENGQKVNRMQTWSVKEDKAYVITYTAVPEMYDTYLPTVEEMIESFELIK
ncbi:MAG: hypothetical protein Tsb0014_10490 [Pleurocapsa sp.]